ncbi:two-partner secretion domain-containing protein [Anabaena subtropica]|uniref:S-layer family protein n=1 Tax=Anabaena subtropica FACHB-260 TaxID=2692884 RepID=A0ABR8CSK0_9NOST|nr:filamentous hemagglutinin N-terminal domain-containing protein [Anabaena subtropica]MBD2344760.1 S-layer family protein [Anabaena subtropica FACHB-260]
MSRHCITASISIILGIGAIISLENSSNAEVIQDTTLPRNTNVTVTTNRLEESTFIIDDGTSIGNNLFHSFTKFSLLKGQTAYFNTTENIQNIFGRVTGREASNIDGTITSRNRFNLFLINPNGIIFGPNARLNIQGSFVASTANNIKFADGGEFSSRATEATPLLNVTTPIGLQYGVNSGSIEVQGESIYQPSTLQVEGNQTLALLGGNIILENANLNTLKAEGRIELGSVASAGLVGINPTSSGFLFNFDSVPEFGDIQIFSGTNINSLGDLNITGKNIVVTDASLNLLNNLTMNAKESIQLMERSSISASNPSNIPGNHTINTKNLLVQDQSVIGVNGGNLIVNASNEVKLTGDIQDIPSRIYASASDNSTFNGNLTINTRNLLVENGSQIITNSSDNISGIISRTMQTKASLTINASESVSLVGSSLDEIYPSGVFTQANDYEESGNLTINTRVLRIEDGAQIIARNLSEGKSGNLTVNATDKVQVIGTSPSGAIPGDWPNDSDADEPVPQTIGPLQDLVITGVKRRDSLPSGLFTNAIVSGDAGSITINTRELIAQNGGRISADTFAEGQGGDLTINATDKVQLFGTAINGVSSGLFTRAGSLATGNAGSLAIFTSALLVQDGAQVSASTFGGGKGGNLSVQGTEGIKLIGVSRNNVASGLFAQTNRHATGDAGSLKIDTSTLLVRDGAQISASTFGAGKGGNLSVQASEIKLIGTAPDALFSSGLFTVATAGSTGNAGELSINTRTLWVSDGAQVSTSTSGDGQGGNLTVKATERVDLIGSALNGALTSGLFATATTNSTGNAGSLTMNTDVLQIRQRAGIAVQSSGKGSAGNLNIHAHSIRLDDKAFISADTRDNGINSQQSQANINLRSHNLILSGGSNITTNATGKNVIGGNINIDTNTLFAIQNSDISANSADFRGGRIRINAQTIFGTKFRNALTPNSDITATGSSPELNGSVEITTPEVDPSQNLTQLPSDAIDVSNQIYQKCHSGEATAQKENQVIITGRGGIPANPYETLDNDAIIADWVIVNNVNSVAQNETNLTKIENTAANTIIEANAWVVDAQGKLVLTAAAPQVKSYSSGLTTDFCQRNRG